MRFLLLHVSSFVPIMAKVILAPWGLKLSWLLYLLFSYILIEHEKWNGYPVFVFENLNRIAELAMVMSLVVSYWVTPLLAPFCFLLVLKKFDVDAIVYSLPCFLLYRYDIVQIILVTLGIMSAHLYTKEPITSHETWERAAWRRIGFRGVQVLMLMMAYERTHVRCILLGAFVLLKAVVWVYTKPDKPQDRNIPGDPVCLYSDRKLD